MGGFLKVRHRLAKKLAKKDFPCSQWDAASIAFFALRLSKKTKSNGPVAQTVNVQFLSTVGNPNFAMQTLILR